MTTATIIGLAAIGISIFGLWLRLESMHKDDREKIYNRINQNTVDIASLKQKTVDKDVHCNNQNESCDRRITRLENIQNGNLRGG